MATKSSSPPTGRGPGFDNPTRDTRSQHESRRHGARQLTFNKGDDYSPPSPRWAKIAYMNRGVQASDGQGGNEIFVMNAIEVRARKTSPTTASPSTIILPSFPGVRRSPSRVWQANLEPGGDEEVYGVNVLDGSGKRISPTTPSDTPRLLARWREDCLREPGVQLRTRRAMAKSM